MAQIEVKLTDLPEPLVKPDCDCTDLDGFMLNVERLMASELVALASHEAIAAALFLWCRAWKQRPAASLPDDDRVNAAFARLPMPRFMKLKSDIMRGFVKCSDGRLYHKTLAPEATAAFAKKATFRNKRENDAERLRKWRESLKETACETLSETIIETPHETHCETRFVAEGQGQGQGHKEEERGVLRTLVDVTKKPHSEKPLKPAGSAGAIHALADRFYAAYPKRINPADAKAKFVRLCKSGVDPAKIIDAAERFAEAHRRTGTDKQMIPAPAVWLNKGGYDSEYLPEPPKQPQSHSGPRLINGVKYWPD